jgi:hypothetical protein
MRYGVFDLYMGADCQFPSFQAKDTRLTTRSAWNSRPLSVVRILSLPFMCSGSSGHVITLSPRTTLTPSFSSVVIADS